MTVSVETATTSVFRAIEAHNTSEAVNVPCAADTILLGVGGAVDSLGLVRLIMTVERQLQDDFGIAISLTDEKAMSQRNSPFRTVGTLIEYITSCLNDSR